MAGVEAVVGMGLVFKPAYISAKFFSSLLMTLSDWSNNPKERLSELCMTFLSVSPKSKVFPLCKEYPVLLDLSSKGLVSNHFTRGHLTSFQAFQLPLVRMISPQAEEWTHYISVPCLMGSASYLMTPHKEGEIPEEGSQSSSTLHLNIPAPNCNHWSIHKDKKFNQLLLHFANECQE